MAARESVAAGDLEPDCVVHNDAVREMTVAADRFKRDVAGETRLGAFEIEVVGDELVSPAMQPESMLFAVQKRRVSHRKMPEPVKRHAGSQPVAVNASARYIYVVVCNRPPGFEESGSIHL